MICARSLIGIRINLLWLEGEMRRELGVRKEGFDALQSVPSINRELNVATNQPYVAFPEFQTRGREFLVNYPIQLPRSAKLEI